MAVVFVGFALTDLVPVKLIGVGLAIGVLLDATVTRLLLVPATMRLLGRANWYPG
jgi:RND superfamily putative drug exporter